MGNKGVTMKKDADKQSLQAVECAPKMINPGQPRKVRLMLKGEKVIGLGMNLKRIYWIRN